MLFENRIMKFEDFSKSIEDEDFLDNSIKGPAGNPNSYKDLKANKLKKDGKTKSKKRRVDVLPSSDGILGINTKDAKLWFRDDY